MKKFYENYDESYYTERVYYSKKHFIRYVKFLLKNKEDIRWLDIGCGLGYLVKEAMEEGIDAYGIEISDYALRNAIIKERVKLGSITDIPFEDEYFDVVSAFDVLEHIHPRDTFKALSEIHRVLKPKGILIMTTPNPCYIDSWIYDLTHINVRPPKYWKMLLEQQDFKVKMPYIPSFIKYHVLKRYSSLRQFIGLIPDKIAFKVEEPLRYVIGWFFNRKGRLYILAIKMR
ncbi:putative S-adenosylmethionine-dependent methyltransferase [Aeropyrum pernix]|uniref:Putative S-adenosylmethionine-dependent methyltransferase n=1 Tax=Aeropyrum pernix TaxID=56636 RepID=A0A401H822_AERPX|nr:class I SAM-dependent methyltransferase [Aeropyrum pernix]GBF08530.1 putative S-adenosylmethionine-dependent methyltransferase [Aeropyrum pernix]